MSTYQQTLAKAYEVGAAHATDEGLIALFCDSPGLQLLCGAVSAKLVFDGTQTKGMSYRDFMTLVHDQPTAVESLMWA